jgi:hypothetical protein
MRTEKYIHTNNITLHCLDFEGGEPTIVLTHGLTANAHSFVEIVKAGLSGLSTNSCEYLSSIIVSMVRSFVLQEIYLCHGL